MPGEILEAPKGDRAFCRWRVVFAGGAIQLLVNNAGIGSPGRLDVFETTEENYDLVMATNLKGAFFLSQAIARDMAEAKRADKSFQGCIVNHLLHLFPRWFPPIVRNTVSPKRGSA